MHKTIFVLLACLCCACSSAKPVDNSTAENPIGQLQTETNSSPIPTTETQKMNTPDNAIDDWTNTLKYGFVMPKSDEAENLIEFVRNHSQFETFVSRYKLGNLAFVEGKTPTKAPDGNAQSGYCAVLLGDNMTFFELPNTKLLSKFINDLRTQPDALSLDKRIMYAMILAKGFDYHLSKSEMESRAFESKYGITPVEPTWTDDGKTITIDYYQMKIGGTQVSIPQKCHVVIDESMKTDISCENAEK